MKLKNSDTHFGLIAILLHWIMAIMIVTLLVVGLYMHGMPSGPLKSELYGLHKEFGALVLMLVIVRFAWRLRNITPRLMGNVRWEEIAARFVHYALYFLMFLQPITGWLMSSSSGYPVSFFGLFTLPDLVSANKANAKIFATLHEWFAYTLIAFFAIHILAALKHYFVNHDNVLQRMLRP